MLGYGTYDVLVIGGGITGAGVALDAASRGMRVALVEAGDFASGTSSKSSKLVHGGLRYLQQGEIGLVYEALAERQILLDNAPHLVEPLPFLIPILSKDGLLPPKVARALGGAMWGYDLTGGLRIGKRHRRLSREETLKRWPLLRADRLASAYLYHDARTDDARLTLAIIRSAALDFGAVAVNRARVVALSHDAAGRVDGATVDVGAGRMVEVAAGAVVNATGVWADDIASLDDGVRHETIRPAKGVHITVPWDLIRAEIAAVVPVPGDKRSVFVVPWGEHCYVGTTDTDYDGPLDSPACTADDVDYLLGAVNSVIVEPVRADQVTGSWAGLRPLVRGATSARTADLSRRHTVQRSASGLVTVAGGKLTTYRRMAVDTVDEVCEILGRHHSSGTKRLRLRGAPETGRVAAGHLNRRYGTERPELDRLVADDPSLGLPLVAGLPYQRVEAVWAVDHEMATTLDDVLSRRTRCRLLDGSATAAALDDVAALIGPRLGWTPDQLAGAVAAYRADLATEAQSTRR